MNDSDYITQRARAIDNPEAEFERCELLDALAVADSIAQELAEALREDENSVGLSSAQVNALDRYDKVMKPSG